MKKRVLSLFVVVLMMISMVSAFPFSMNAAATITFEIKPIVYIGGGNEYNIVWKNNIDSIGYVTYTIDGRKITVYDEEGGVVRSDDKYHTVRVPMSDLDKAGAYEVVAVGVENRLDYSITLGNKVSTSSSFQGFDGGSEVKIGFFSDLHSYSYDRVRKTVQSAKHAIDNYMTGIDLIVLNGDLINYQHTSADFDCILETAYTTGEGKLPVLYTRGNHECWGEQAQHITKYLSFNTGEMYCTFNFGPLSVLVVDCGEDKEDTSIDFGDTRDNVHYMEEQLAWLKYIDAFADNSKYNLSIGHAHGGSAFVAQSEFVNAMNKQGVDLQVCGHSHMSKFYPAGTALGQSGASFPILHDGGHDDNTSVRSSFLTVSNGVYNIKALDEKGSILFEENVKSKAYTSSKSSAALEVTEEETETVEETSAAVDIGEIVENNKNYSVPTKAGISTMSLKGAASTVAFTTKPVVFDGGEYYNIVWQSSSNTRDAGYVDVTYSSSVIRYKDSAATVIRADKNTDTHSVRIPKESLNDCYSFEAKMRVVTNWEYWGNHYTDKEGTSYGGYISAGSTKFVTYGADGDDSISVLVLSNSKSISDVATVKSSYKDTPDLVVTLGNMVNGLNTESDFSNYLRYMYQITSGTFPIVFLRGEGETKGEFAANLNRFLRPVSDNGKTGTFYYFSTYGDLSFVALDTGAEKADNHASYNGYASFDKIRKEQVTWLKEGFDESYKNTYNIVFAHADDVTNNNGVNYSQYFGNLGTNLVVTGEKGTSSFNDGGDSYATATCGSISGDKSTGLYITCAKDKITVDKIGSKKTTLGTVDVKISAADNESNPSNEQDPSKPNSNTGTTTPTTPGSTDPGESITTNTKVTTTTDVSYVPGEYDGVDGAIYVRTLKEGWYKDFLGLGIEYVNSSSVNTDGTMTEGTFITLVAKLEAVNLALYTDASIEEKSVSWADEYEIYGGYLSVSTPITDSVINAILTTLFPV